MPVGTAVEAHGDELPAEADNLPELPGVAEHLFRALATRTSISPPSRSTPRL